MFNYRHLAPGAREVGLGAAVLASLCLDSRGSAAEPLEATFSAQAAQLIAVSSESNVQCVAKIDCVAFGRHMRSTSQPKATQNGPRAAQGSQREAKVTERIAK